MGHRIILTLLLVVTVLNIAFIAVDIDEGHYLTALIGFVIALICSYSLINSLYNK